MDDFAISDQPPESLDQFLQRRDTPIVSRGKIEYDPKELIVEVEIEEKEPEDPQLYDNQYWKVESTGYNLDSLMEDYQ